MAKTQYATVDEYIAAFPPDVQRALTTVREAIRAAVPEAEEVISYSIPAFRLHGPVLYFSAYTKHLAVSSVPETIEHFQGELGGYKTSKSQFQVPHGTPIPVELIARMAKWRAGENTRRAEAT
ncbi:Uncharacterized conserved protein YdhG, YjbR/CyaY-like superfamily, DUF1801 family [Glycomyces sambucus]|uniref:Uncharacterized conserved protein YdhG, YjbR/CyaY-like superfamily, DUF1801 family n=1 Tax=Glycomyces sambucus TaxID=380244 RepID=A0A1G9K812_9ACTN|nr:DUF1801 domain-containing protein [Glycomyces sambucus]SDL46050.1 Uncharacterized conserved protein YdhG, YjbR/CyaY-like superfamily, DUF1801 family [Glycomyces sambucus]